MVGAVTAMTQMEKSAMTASLCQLAVALDADFEGALEGDRVCSACNPMKQSELTWKGSRCHWARLFSGWRRKF